MACVLVLDDRAPDRELLATVLGYAGYEVLQSSSAHEALKTVHARRPDLVVTDILMPEVNGYQFVRRLREDPDVGDTPVIFSTGSYDDEQVMKLARECGVSDFLPKPCELNTVIDTVTRVLGSPQAPRPPLHAEEFDRSQLRVLNDKLVEQVSALEALSAERHKLVAQLLIAQEGERRRIARDIHDDSIQTVIAVGMRLEMLGREVADDELRRALARLREDVEEATARLRTLLAELEPASLDREGLTVALREALDRAKQEDGLDYELEDRLAREPQRPTRILLYRLAQELLANVRKHAQATSVSVLVGSLDGDYRLRVSDDGRGFSPEHVRVRPGHLGLPSMRERVQAAGGSLRIESRPGSGSTVEARVPEVTASLGGLEGAA